MSEINVTSAGWTKRKIAGVPALYLALGVVVVLVALAWRMKTSAAPTAPVDETAPELSTDTLRTDYPPLPLGTVTAPTTVPGPALDNASITTNDEWLKRGVMFLAGIGYGPGDAQLALTAYLDGSELSYDQGKMRDAAIRELGMPPYPVNVGGTREDVARSQGPLPRNHIVKNGNEDTATELAQLYYGRADAFTTGVITSANGGRANYTPGESVYVPTLPVPSAPTPPPSAPTPTAPSPTPTAPRTYKVVSGDNLTKIAAKFGTTWRAIYDANRDKIKDPNLIYPGQILTIP